MNLIDHAKQEFKVLGCPGDCDMCKSILELLRVFAAQGHSGSSALYCLSLFERLSKHQPLGPLTGADSE